MALQLVLIVLFAVSAVLKAGELVLRRQDRASTALLAAAFALLAAGLLLSLPPLTRALNGAAAGVGNIVFNGLTFAGLYLLVVFFLRAVRGPAARRRIGRETAVLAGTLVVLVALTVLMPAEFRSHSLSSPFLGEPPVVAFYVIGGAYFVWAYLVVIRLIWAYARDGAGPVVWALRLIAAGLVGLTVTALVRIGRVLVIGFGGPPLAALNTVNFQLSLLSYLAVSAGLVLAGVGQALALLRGTRERRRKYDALEPLWSVLTSLYPEIVLRGARPYPGNRRLYRRVLECRDGLLRSGPVIARAAGTSDLGELGPERIAAHLRALAADRPAPVDAEPLPVATPEGAGLDGDVDALVAISAALRTGRP